MNHIIYLLLFSLIIYHITFNVFTYFEILVLILLSVIIVNTSKRENENIYHDNNLVKFIKDYEKNYL